MVTGLRHQKPAGAAISSRCGRLRATLAALIVTARIGGLRASSDLLGRIFLPGPRRWLAAAALVGPFLPLGVGLTADRLGGGAPFDLSRFGRSPEFPALSALGLLIYNVVTFGIGEEAGWRGFALLWLQSRCSALMATAILCVIWACWHLPLFVYRSGYVGMDIGGIAGWLVSLATGAILLTALFNASRGSILRSRSFTPQLTSPSHRPGFPQLPSISAAPSSHWLASPLSSFSVRPISSRRAAWSRPTPAYRFERRQYRPVRGHETA